MTQPTAQGEFVFDERRIADVRRNFESNLRFRLATLMMVPMDFLAGLRMPAIDGERCRVSVPYKWLNKNPFRSTFWAVLGMAAEMSTGALVLLYTRGQEPSIATIVTGVEAEFVKKATGPTTFECADGAAIAETVRRAMTTGEAQEVVCEAVGTDRDDQEVARFRFTWSMKVRSRS